MLLIFAIDKLPDDLALLKIDPPFEESDNLWPIQLNDDHENLVGEEVLISGWGRTTNEFEPEQLQKVFVTVKDQELDTSPMKAGHLLHLWSPDGKGACQGDSGGKKSSIDDATASILVKFKMI